MDSPFDEIMDDPRYTAAVDDARAALAVAFHGREAVDVVRELAMTEPGEPCRYCGTCQHPGCSEHLGSCIWKRARDLLIKILDVGS